jgi:hypothetical protein
LLLDGNKHWPVSDGAVRPESHEVIWESGHR